MSIYQDPRLVGRDRPELITELLAQPAWDKQHQLENQASIVLAWLADRSLKVAHRLLSLWLGDLDIPDDLVIGARNQVIMPSKLRPDISIDVEGRTVQLLIEVKVGADFAVYDGTLQHEKYRQEWMELGPGEAYIRAVGTLTRDVSERRELVDRVDLNRLCARDVEWGELRQVLMGVAEEGGVGATIEAVIRSFCDAIALNIEVPTVDEESLPDFFALAQPLVEEIASGIGHVTGVAPSLNNGAHYAGAKITYQALDDLPVVIRVFAGTAGGVMTAVGDGPTLVVAVGRDHSALFKGDDRSRALSVGMQVVKTPKYVFTGFRYALDEAIADPGAVIAKARMGLLQALLLPPGSDPARSKEIGAAMDWQYIGKMNFPPGWKPSKSVRLNVKYKDGKVVEPGDAGAAGDDGEADRTDAR